MKILDSSVIVAFFRENELDHIRAVDLIQSSEDFVIPDHVLAEVATVLKIREGFEVANEALKYLLSTDGIKINEMQPELFWSAMDFFGKSKNNLSFTDTLLLLFSRENRIPLVTFDKELAKMAK